MSKKLMSYLPDYYEEIEEFVQIMDAEDIEFDKLNAAMVDTFRQFHPETATWGIKYWEKDLKIVSMPSKPIEQRRSVVISKMRGSGKVSASMIKNVADSYDRGEVDVTVFPAEYYFVIRFIGTLGIPPNLQDLKDAIEEIKPAHLEVRYKFRYLVIREIHNVMRINEINNIPLNNFAGGVPIGQ
ncbi:YmfQ family protein [Paenibacillus polymyxa]|uniref:YmfQ family protein n=1 Tax=Paenibacillus polymyxa TaxID=1406 RepID=UPI002AB5A77D|nr:YmfQ family protein [Paenibacillus polymyxa]MDY8046594.1 YmfQ family protein [Paenibacillus polymyxa]